MLARPEQKRPNTGKNRKQHSIAFRNVWARTNKAGRADAEKRSWQKITSFSPPANGLRWGRLKAPQWNSAWNPGKQNGFLQFCCKSKGFSATSAERTNFFSNKLNEIALLRQNNFGVSIFCFLRIVIHNCLCSLKRHDPQRPLDSPQKKWFYYEKYTPKSVGLIFFVSDLTQHVIKVLQFTFDGNKNLKTT